MRQMKPTILFASMLLSFGAASALAQAPSNNPANNASRNTTMQPGSTAVTPQALAGKDGTPIAVTTVRSGSVFTIDEAGNVTQVVTPSVTPELDKAVARQRLRDQKIVAINGQRWNMIVPRTNVDRTNQMPDDPPSPLLQR